MANMAAITGIALDPTLTLTPIQGQFSLTDPSMYADTTKNYAESAELGTLVKSNPNGKKKFTLRIVLPCPPTTPAAGCCPTPTQGRPGVTVFLSISSSECATHDLRKEAIQILNASLSANSIRDAIFDGITETK